MVNEKFAGLAMGSEAELAQELADLSIDDQSVKDEESDLLKQL